MNSKVQHTKIEAIYACVPEQEVLTTEYSLFASEEARLFTKNTGIHARRVAPDNITCSDLCFNAAAQLLTDIDIAGEIDLLVFVSQSPDYFLPATSIILQDRLGLRSDCMAFDIKRKTAMNYWLKEQDLGVMLVDRNFVRHLEY